MKECKIIHLCCKDDIAGKIVAEYPSPRPYNKLMVVEYPQMEAILNSYLAQGWEVVAMREYDGVFVRLEREK